MKAWAYAAVSGQTLIASATFLVAHDATTRFTALELLTLRMLLGALLMAGAFLLLRCGRPVPERRDWPRLAATGLLGVTINQGCFIWGISLSTPLHSSLLYAFTPVVVLFLAAAFLGERPTVAKATGIGLAVLGVVLVLTARGLNLTTGPLRGDLITLVAVAAWAGYTVLGKPLVQRYGPLAVNAWAFGFGALAILPALFWMVPGFDPARPGTAGWMELLFLAAITSGVAFTLWYVAVRRLEATQVAVFTNLQAPLTALLVWAVHGEVPTEQLLLGGLLVLAGVSVVQFSPRWARPRTPIPRP